jgi:hypothetical protein
VRLVTREEWDALPSKGSSGLFAPGWGDFLVVHYTGISARPDPTEFDQKAEYLRGLQRYYQSGKHPNGDPIGTFPDGTPRYAPFVDVGYNFACWNDAEPTIWELRGLRMRGGANGTASSNAVRPSCLIVADVNEGVHPAVPRKMAWLVQLIRDQSQRQTGTRGHRDEFNTGCPGELIYPLVTSGAFLPENQTGPDPTPEPPTIEDDMPRRVTFGGQAAIFVGDYNPATNLVTTVRWLSPEQSEFYAPTGDVVDLPWDHVQNVACLGPAPGFGVWPFARVINEGSTDLDVVAADMARRMSNG